MKRPKYLRTEKEETKIMTELATHLNYEPDTGIFRWNKRMSLAVRAGVVAGCVDKTNGYRNFIHKGEKIKAHRLAWFIYYGTAPKSCLDHVDGNKDNNRIENLREVDEFMNQQNRPCHRKGTLWGTSRVQKGKYFLSIVRGKYVGIFKTVEEAHASSVAYAKRNNLTLLKEI